MEQAFEFFFGAYFGVSPWLVGLEMTAVFLGVLSVWFAHKERILVFPTGFISTGIFVYILWVYGLLGDMIINGYYSAMSIYGWWFWWYKKTVQHAPQISRVASNEWRKAGYLFIGAIFFCGLCVPILWNVPCLDRLRRHFNHSNIFCGHVADGQKKVGTLAFLDCREPDQHTTLLV